MGECPPSWEEEVASEEEDAAWEGADTARGEYKDLLLLIRKGRGRTEELLDGDGWKKRKKGRSEDDSADFFSDLLFGAGVAGALLAVNAHVDGIQVEREKPADIGTLSLALALVKAENASSGVQPRVNCRTSKVRNEALLAASRAPIPSARPP